MAKSAQQLVAEMSDRKRRNLDFFSRWFPNIAQLVANRELDHSRINVDPNTLSVDLLVNDIAVYGGAAESYNKNEAKEFSDAFKIGGINLPLRHSYVDDFLSGRFHHSNLQRFMKTVGATEGSARPYIFEYSLPQVVFLGCGFGWHIAELIKLRNIQHIVLVEHDLDRFLSSLYLTDWESIIQPYIDEKARSFQFSIADTYSQPEEIRERGAFMAAWNGASANVPFLPVQTVLYVHKADPFYGRVADRFNNEIEPFINVWGYYDDEVNQLNHVLHNFTQKIPVIKKVDFSENERITLVCGNGPSLTPYIDLIKQHRNKLNIISAGSTTHTLLTQDIYPDLVVTIESDLATYKALTLLPADKAKKVPLIGAAQIHPKTFSLFADGLMFLKAETAYAQAFGREQEQIRNSPPSATNGALAVTLDLKLPNVFLVGLDFGFKQAEQSHAEGAFYYGEKSDEHFKNFKENISKQSYFLEQNQHGKIYTTPFYNTARTHIQRKITEAKRTDITNLSQGASIEGTEFSSITEFKGILENTKVRSNVSDLFEQIKSQARVYSDKDIESGLKTIRNYLTDTSRQIMSKLKKLEPNKASIDATLFEINEVVSGHNSKNKGSIAMFMRGTVWQWLFNYYALTKRMDLQDDLDTITREWKQHFSFFLRKIPAHFDQYIANRSPEDEKLNLTISEPEPYIEQWLYQPKSEKNHRH